MPFSLLPKIIANHLTDITPELLHARDIRLLMLDFDNTIVPYTTDVPTAEMTAWLDRMKQTDIIVCIVSNSHKDRVPPSLGRSLACMPISAAACMPTSTAACAPRAPTWPLACLPARSAARTSCTFCVLPDPFREAAVVTASGKNRRQNFASPSMHGVITMPYPTIPDDAEAPALANA